MFIKTIVKIEDLNANRKDTRSRLQAREKPQEGKTHKYSLLIESI